MKHTITWNSLLSGLGHESHFLCKWNASSRKIQLLHQLNISISKLRSNKTFKSIAHFFFSFEFRFKILELILEEAHAMAVFGLGGSYTYTLSK